MVQTAATKKDLERHLQQKQKAAKSIAVKIANDKDVKTKNKATRVYKTVQKELAKIEEAITIDPGMYSNHINQLIDHYIKIMQETFPNAKTKFRREELFVAILTHKVLEYVADNVPAYLSGDVQFEGKYDNTVLDIQIKSPTDVFRIFYKIDAMKERMKVAGLPDGVISAAAQAASQDYTFTYKQLSTKKGKIEFMERYLQISQANWYLLFYEHPASFTAVGLPKQLLIEFVKFFYRYFIPIKEKEVYALKLDLTYANKFHIKVWSSIVNIGGVIHYRDKEEFYQDRHKHMTASERKSYHDNFWGKYKHGNLQIQNTLFDPIKY